MRHPSKIIESMIFSSLLLFSIIGMSGVSIFDAVKLSMFLAIQVSGGVALWYTVNNYRPIGIPEATGMGLALGTSITTLSQYLLRDTAFSDFSWITPLIFLIPLIVKSNEPSQKEIPDKHLGADHEEFSSLVAIFTLTMLAMAALWWWLYPIVVAMSCVCFIRYQKMGNQNKRSYINRFSIPISLIGIAASLLLRHQNSFWKVLSNDQVFSESMSWSIFKWGNSESPFAAGTPVNYHWFVLLWSGITSAATNAEAWVVVSRVLPIISFLGIFCLIWTLTKGIYDRFSAPLIAILFLVFYSNSFGFSLTRYIVSPTFLFSCVWLLAFAKSVFNYYRNPSIKLAILVHDIRWKSYERCRWTERIAFRIFDFVSFKKTKAKPIQDFPIGYAVCAFACPDLSFDVQRASTWKPEHSDNSEPSSPPARSPPTRKKWHLFSFSQFISLHLYDAASSCNRHLFSETFDQNEV